MKNAQLNTKFTKMSSKSMLAKICKGGMAIKEATAFAKVFASRFEKPQHMQVTKALDDTIAQLKSTNMLRLAC